MMDRRELLLLLGGALTAAHHLRAEQKAMPVIGFLSSDGFGALAPRLAALRHGLSETGYVEGQNVAIEYRWAEGHFDRLPALAADLVDRKVDVIVTSGGETSARAAKNATSSIPIVFLAAGDPRKVWSPVSPGRAETSRAWHLWGSSCGASGSNCSPSWFPRPARSPTS